MNLFEIFSIAVIGIVILYLFLIMPRIFNRPDNSGLKNHLYTHRGFFDNSSDAPENSMAAFRAAVDKGYGIEFDVQISRDGIPVIFHDDSLERACGETIPALQEFLDMVDGRVPLIVELKVNGNAENLCRAADPLLQKYRGPYCIESFHPAAVRWYGNNRPEVIRGQLSARFNKGKSRAERTFSYAVLSLLLANRISKPDFIAYDCKYPKSLSLVLCRKLYKTLTVAWTVKSQSELERLSNQFDLFIFEGFTPRTGT